MCGDLYNLYFVLLYAALGIINDERLHEWINEWANECAPI